MRGAGRLSIVIPAFNEAGRLPRTLAAVRERLDGEAVEIVVVDDGSADGTAAVARELLADLPSARVIELRPNRGKGAAVRAGMLASTGDTVVFMDADLATDLDALDPLLAALEHADIAVGSRAVPGSVVYRGTKSRAAIALACRVLVRALTKVRVRDTQCGFKAFHGPTGRLLFAMAECDGFSFDVEVLDLARILGFRAVEVPVVWTAVEGSSVRLVRDPARMTVDLVRIALRLRTEPTRARARALGWERDQAGSISSISDD